jgi:hypothetical protein
MWTVKVMKISIVACANSRHGKIKSIILLKKLDYKITGMQFLISSQNKDKRAKKIAFYSFFGEESKSVIVG